MKNKTLLIAAAALVAGVISSEAQVYSANIVGYVNVVFPANTNVFVSTPLTTGNDVLTNVVVGVPGGTQLQLWDPVNGVFNTLTYSGPAANRHWKDTGGNNQDNVAVPVGTSAYFVLCGSAYTNTFVGSVVANAGASVTNVLQTGFNAVGGLIPYGDYITNTATVNFVPPGGTQIQQWDPVNTTFNVYTYSGPVSNRTWKDVNSTVVYPTLSPAQAMFIIPGASINWVQTLP